MELDAELQAFLRTGCALLVGVTQAANRPLALRGWGCEPTATTARILVARPEVHDLHVGAQVAVTNANVRTLRSLQLKGIITNVEPIAESTNDLALVRAYCDDFYGTVNEVDGYPLEALEFMTPVSFAAFTFDIHEAYNQTPGPLAGSVLK